MPYGVKRGFKAPGDFGMGDIAGLALSGAAGIIAALVTDYQQQGEASALFTINQWVIQMGSLLGFTDIPLWWVIAGMTGIGAGSIFYFQPITRQGAFAQGFGLLAVLMTTIPPDLAGGIESFNDSLPGLEASTAREASANPRIVNAAFSEPQARPQFVQAERGPNKFDVHMEVTFPKGIPDDIDSLIRRGILRGRLHNEDTNETWSIFKSSGGTVRREGDTLIVHAGVPARSENARLWVRIECPGYVIEEQSMSAMLGRTIEWDLVMQETNRPLFLQRLGRSYWF